MKIKIEMKKNSIAFVALTVLLAACSDKKNDTNTQSNDKAIVETKDLHTLSNADSIRMKHLSLDLSIDLAAQKLSGWATWDIENPSDVKTLRLDNNKLKIDSVLVDDKAVIFDLGVAQEHLGAALMIPIGKASQKVAIKYSAGDGATALQWLNAAQTTGKKHPFLYTQSESIYARTWVPCPDGPDIRFTYSARIAVPKGMMAVMSADGNPLQANASK